MLNKTGLRFNASLYTIVLTAQKLLSFVFFSYLARSLGAENTGSYFFAMSLAAILSSFLDVGLTPVVTRNAARSETETQKYLVHTLYIKMGAILILIVGAVGIIPFTVSSPLERSILYCAIFLSIIDTLAISLYSALRARRTLLYESIGAILFQVFILIAGSIAVYAHADVRLILGVVIAATILHAAVAVFALRRVFSIRLSEPFDKNFARTLIIAAFPFLVAAIFIKINAYSDSMLLKLFLDDAALGVYSVAYKITFAFQFIPLALTAALYPALSHYQAHSPEKIRDYFLDSSKYLMVIIMPIAAGIIALAADAIPFVYGSTYALSVGPLVILLISLPLVFLNFPIGSLLNATNAQTTQTANQGIAMVVAVTANIILIPHLRELGAATASLLSTAALFIAGIVTIRLKTTIPLQRFFSINARIVLSGIMVLCAVVFLKQVMPWYMAIAPGALVYCISLYFFQLVTHTDIQNFIRKNRAV